MHEMEALIRKYLKTAHMMQVATVKADQPWICTVYFVEDEQLNLYWISTPGRRHSQEIINHTQVAAAIPVQFSRDERVIGIQLEGDGRRVTEQQELKHATRLYDDKFKHDAQFYEDFVADRRQHKFYMIKPRLFVLFDEQTYSKDARKEWRPGGIDDNRPVSQ